MKHELSSAAGLRTSQRHTASVKRKLERVKGIEPSYAAWEAAVLPLNYTRIVCRGDYSASPHRQMEPRRCIAHRPVPRNDQFNPAAEQTPNSPYQTPCPTQPG